MESCLMFVKIQKTRRWSPAGTCGNWLATLTQPWMFVRPELCPLFVPVHQTLLDKESCQAGADIKT